MFSVTMVTVLPLFLHSRTLNRRFRSPVPGRYVLQLRHRIETPLVEHRPAGMSKPL